MFRRRPTICRTRSFLWRTALATGNCSSPQGAPGPASVAVGSVTTGSSAAVTNTGTQNAAVLNFTLPRGDTGATGPAGLTFQGAWNAAYAYSVNGRRDLRQRLVHCENRQRRRAPNGCRRQQRRPGPCLQHRAPPAPQDPPGLTGPTGASPTIAIASTTTGAAGTAASVTNSGTATALQLNFVIPQGVACASGSGSGLGFYTTVHTVAPMNAGLQVYSPLVDGHSAGDAFAVLAWLPATCKLETVLIYNSSNSDAKVEIHAGVPGLMAVTAAGTCTARAKQCHHLHRARDAWQQQLHLVWHYQ